MHDVERDAGQPTDLNVGERAVLELPWARTADTLPGGPAPTEIAAAVNREPDLQPRRSTRDRRVPAWMRDFLLGEDIDNALSPLGRGGCVTLLRDLSSLAPGLRGGNHVRFVEGV